MNWLKENKIIAAVITITLVLFVGGIFIFSKKPSLNSTPIKVNKTFLTPNDGFVTSGLVKGEYLPASSSAKVTITEFGDYECPACVAIHPVISKVLTDFAGKVNFSFKNYPLPQHKNAPLVSYAAEAAGLQGKYWEMRDLIFNSQDKWVGVADPKAGLISLATGLGLDMNKFNADLDSNQVKEIVKKDTDDGNAVFLTETPTIYINGVKFDISLGETGLKSAINTALSSTN